MTTITPGEAAKQLATIQATIEQLASKADELKAIILAAVQPGETVSVNGHPIYKVSPGRRTFKEAKAREQLPAAILEAATVTKIDAAAVKRLSPALWEACCESGAPFLTAVK